LKAGLPDITTTETVDILEGWVIPEDQDKFNLAIDHLQDWSDVHRAANKILEASSGFPTAAS
jgi:hypothetical protein